MRRPRACPSPFLVLVPMLAPACSEAPPFARADAATADLTAADRPGADGCAPGAVCTACRPGALRCDPAAPETPQSCAPDGARWVPGAACDGAVGMHCVQGRCARPCEALGESYLGCEYWPVATVNGSLSAEFEFAVVVANPQRHPVRVTVEGGGLAASVARSVAPGGVETIRLPWTGPVSQNTGSCCAPPLARPGRALCAARSVQAPGGAFHLRADGPIAAYQFNPLEYRHGDRYSFTNDASLLLPRNALGRHYLVFAWPNDGPPFGVEGDRCSVTSLRGGFVAVVGAQTEGSNQLRVRTTCATWDPRDPSRVLPAGEHAFTLARGEVLQLVSQGIGADLTGTYLDASAPVAVYAGHDCAAVPAERSACDHLEEQLLPITAWGRSYAVSPVRYREGGAEPSRVRIMAQRDGVMLAFEGITAPPACRGALARGRFCELETAQGFLVTGTGPIAVMQYLRGLGDPPECRCGGETCPGGPRCLGDPSMVLEAPVDQYRNAYRFLVPDTFGNDLINVTAPPDAVIELDGARVGGAEMPLGAGFAARVVPVRPGAHEIHAVDPGVRFGIKVYGVAPYTSYAYPGGLDAAPIAPP